MALLQKSMKESAKNFTTEELDESKVVRFQFR